MAKTAWRDAPYAGRSRWLCTDGTVLTAPVVQTTPSQRRWRISGTEDSVMKHDLPAKIDTYMKMQAITKGKTAWLELDEDEDTTIQLHRNALTSGYNHFAFKDVPEIKLSSRSSTAIAFEFRAKQFPDLRAILWVLMTLDGGSNATVTSALTYRSTNPDDGHDHKVHKFQDKTGWHGGMRAGGGVQGITWPLDEEKFGSNPRKAANRFAELLRWAVDVDTIGLPDYRERYTADVLEFEFKRTNYTPDLYRRLLDVVQSGPSMERLKGHLQGVKTELANLGVVTSDKEGFDLLALLNGKLSELQVQIAPQDEDNGHNRGLDSHHAVHLDLGRGIFVVSCSRHNLEEVAEQWGVAKFKADLTGETDVLMAYAEAYNQPGEQARLKKVIRERQVKPLK